MNESSSTLLDQLEKAILCYIFYLISVLRELSHVSMKIYHIEKYSRACSQLLLIQSLYPLHSRAE